ncbi:hypothetical protein BGW36DRAFT_422574 [Talaromyces proteolyticus]|uniref:C2H2-type domain-containing protein n=1 Tax=Talaromyces proteolyticus TaxID=1131652 RepID=A0AAD4L1Y4_9EURO|nr:uncharacterized protein BGW36DRAFT_422574 [Talaromyces proteolyticus]KAH8706052.1 hypothetical protein BGW36DRAFT_422574 [Talaromyces proteolyticus]
MALPQGADVVITLSDDESIASADSSSIFSTDSSDDSSDSSVSDNESDSDSDDSDDDDDDDEEEEEDEGELSREEYLAKAEQLDLSQLRQKRYSDGTQDKLDETRQYWDRFCRRIGVDPARQWQWISDSDETVRFLYAFFGWRCDIRRGKNGRHCPGIKRKSSLESFWKWWHLVLKQESETLSGLSKDIMIKVDDILALVAEEKHLDCTRRLKKNMYIEDVAEFASVVLSTTEMTFQCGWQRIQLLLFTQLAAYTASRPAALLHLRYQNLGLKFIRDPEGGRPKLIIFLKPEFTKRFLGTKAPNEYKIPEIIFDPSLVLSPHVCLLSMLFHIKGFKRLSKTGPVLDCAEKLYSLRVLDGLGEQPLLLNTLLDDKYVFCQVDRETTGCRIALDKRMTASMVRSQMRLAGQITGFDQVIKPYLLRYAGAKAFNSSKEITDALQNVMLQHSDIRTFIRHYEVDVDVDAQGIVRKTGSQTPLVRFACSLSASIDPNRPYRLSTEEARSLNELPAICTRQDTVIRWKQKWENRKAKLERLSIACQAKGTPLPKRYRKLQAKLDLAQDQVLEAKRRYNKAVRALKNEKQRQKNRRIRENLKRYREEQPVIDVECQLAGMMIGTKVRETLEHQNAMSAQHLRLIERMMTVPGKTLEAEYQRRIQAIDAGTAYCGVEEGRPTRRTIQPRRPPPDDEESSGPVAKRPRCSVEEKTDNALSRAIKSVIITEKSQRPVVCFLCVGNPQLPMTERIKEYKNSGSLTRHFLRKHAKPAWTKMIRCNVCNTDLEHKMALMSHAELKHGTVSRSSPSALGL